MKKLLWVTLLFGIVFSSCSSLPQSQRSDDAVMKPEKNEEGEWELIVIDSDFDYFLNAIAKPESMYSEATLEQRNTMLVSEWNSYYYSGRYRKVIESAIQYDTNENYGKAFNYKLYQVFAYVGWKYGLRMRGLSAADAR